MVRTNDNTRYHCSGGSICVVKRVVIILRSDEERDGDDDEGAEAQYRESGVCGVFEHGGEERHGEGVEGPSWTYVSEPARMGLDWMCLRLLNLSQSTPSTGA